MQSFSIPKIVGLDSLYQFKETAEQDYCETIRKVIESKPFGDYKFYLHVITKKEQQDNGSVVVRLIHHPRLTKPEPVPGTTLYKCNPNDSGTVYILWTLPYTDNDELYKQGRVFESEFVYDCIQKYLNNPKELMAPEPDDLPPEKIREIYRAYKDKFKRKESSVR